MYRDAPVTTSNSRQPGFSRAANISRYTISEHHVRHQTLSCLSQILLLTVLRRLPFEGEDATMFEGSLLDETPAVRLHIFIQP